MAVPRGRGPLAPPHWSGAPMRGVPRGAVRPIASLIFRDRVARVSAYGEMRASGGTMRKPITMVLAVLAVPLVFVATASAQVPYHFTGTALYQFGGPPA